MAVRHPFTLLRPTTRNLATEVSGFPGGTRHALCSRLGEGWRCSRIFVDHIQQTQYAGTLSGPAIAVQAVARRWHTRRLRGQN